MEDNTILINRIKNSSFNTWQKNSLIELLPKMQVKQKEQLLTLLTQATELKQKQIDHVNKYKTIYKEYQQAVQAKKHEMVQHAQAELQKLDEEESGAELEALETKLNVL